MYFVNKGIFVSFHEFITLNIVKLSKKKPVQLNGHRIVKKRIFYKRVGPFSFNCLVKCQEIKIILFKKAEPKKLRFHVTSFDFS